MANLPENSIWENVYQIEVTDPVLGGPTGTTNVPLKNLTNRTKYLKDHVDALEPEVAALVGADLENRLLVLEGANLPDRVSDLETNDTLISNRIASIVGAATGLKHCIVTAKRSFTSPANDGGQTFLNNTVLTGSSKKVVINASADEPLVLSISGGYGLDGAKNYYFYLDADVEIPFSTTTAFLLVADFDANFQTFSWLMEPFITPVISYNEPTTASNGTYWYDLTREQTFKRIAGIWTATNRLIVAKINDPDDIVEYYPWFGKSMMTLYGRGPVPAGTIHTFAGDILKIPTGYLLANGGAISRTLYSDLFYAIGTTYGVGDGSTTFNLPDLRGEFIRGLDNARGVDTGRTLGSAQTDMFKSHIHTMKKFNRAIGTGAGFFAMDDNGTDGSENTEATGGTETRPRNIAMNYIIKF